MPTPQIIVNRPGPPEPTVTLSDISLDLFRDIVVALRLTRSYPSDYLSIRVFARTMEDALSKLDSGVL